jgi:hypothetical protein
MTALPHTQPDDEDDLQSYWDEPLQAEYISREEGERLLDEMARKHLDMSSPDFRRKFRDGEITFSDHPEVIRLYFVLGLGLE